MKRPPRDENRAAAAVVRKATASPRRPRPTGLEAAWAAWARQIQRVDERTLTLLRAAFEAVFEAGSR